MAIYTIRATAKIEFDIEVREEELEEKYLDDILEEAFLDYVDYTNFNWNWEYLLNKPKTYGCDNSNDFYV